MKLKTRELLAFALLSIPLSMGGLPLAIYLTPYYTAELGLSLASVGLVLLITRVSDVVTDPLIGALSDRTPARYGRRSLWILIGLPIMAFATLAVFDPPERVGFVYLLIAVATLYLGWTLISIPLLAWAAEISPDYHERSRITGARTLASTSGTFMVMALPMLLVYLVDAGFTSLAPRHEDSLQPMLTIVAWATITCLCVFGPLLFFVVPQPRFVQHSALDLRVALKLVWNNRPFIRLMISGMMTHVGWYCISTLYVFFMVYYLLADARMWSGLLLLYFGCSFIGTPIIVALGRRFNKHRLLAGLSLFAMAVFSTVLVMEPRDYLHYGFIQIFAGLVANAGAVLVPSMAADVIDQDTLESGQQRGALFMALWGMADKLALAAAAGLTLPLLQLLGFDPTIDNDLAGLKALQYTYVLVPLLFLVSAALVIWNFPITKERQEQLREKLDAASIRIH